MEIDDYVKYLSPAGADTGYRLAFENALRDEAAIKIAAALAGMVEMEQDYSDAPLTSEPMYPKGKDMAIVRRAVNLANMLVVEGLGKSRPTVKQKCDA